MSLTYFDESQSSDTSGPKPHAISRLISSYMELEDCINSVRQTFRIVDLLLLSNHLAHANLLAHALYKHMSTILPKHTPWPDAQTLRYFWFTHPSYPAPVEASYEPRLGDGSPEALEAVARFERSQWESYRECTRTGWMLEHCDLAGPHDPHVWKETEDGPLIAMCARLLAKEKTPGHYPTSERLSEALAAAEKLYSLRQVPVRDWEIEGKAGQGERRHSYLLHRRLVVEIALRLDRLVAAADILSQGLLLDGFPNNDGASLDCFLMLPGIYHIIPLLAAKGKHGNPFYIEEDDATLIVQMISATLERRAKYGRQWSLAPEKVGWRELLDRLAQAAWMVNSKEYKIAGIMSAADILNDPDSEEDIVATEDRVGPLPEDLKDMFRIAGGFKGGWHFLEGGLGSCKDINLRDEDMIWEHFLDENDLNLPADIYQAEMDVESVMELRTGSDCDCFRHYIVPPADYRRLAHDHDDYREGEYRYCYTSSWMGQIIWHKSVRDWVALSVEELERQIQDGNSDLDQSPEDA